MLTFSEGLNAKEPDIKKSWYPDYKAILFFCVKVCVVSLYQKYNTAYMYQKDIPLISWP